MLKKLGKIKFISFYVIFLTFFYNEYLIYWHTLAACRWQEPTKNNLNMMLIADTHLLGSRNGHWFDKLRREWQQHRAFQTARFLLKPDYIVIMGDLTDEGKWCSDRFVCLHRYFLNYYSIPIFIQFILLIIEENGPIMKTEYKSSSTPMKPLN